MLTVIASERFEEHVTPPGHPERPERAAAMQAVVRRWAEADGAVVEPRPAADADLLRVHDEEHLAAVVGTRGRAAMLDADTFTSPESEAVARLAAGAVLTGVDLVLDGGVGSRALAVVRPPGHHAEADKAMGFCLYNSVAAGAAYARARGVGRVAVVDYDVHHGNGTQHIFESDPDVLYVSLHQSPFYPGTGMAEEVGMGKGAGATVNVPMEAGAADEDYRLVFADLVLPVLRQFKPELLLVSAGFDAHERDPLASMRLTTPVFAAMTSELRLVADECCDGRLAVVTEGGYDLRAVADSLRSVVAALEPETARTPVWPASTVAPSRAREAVASARRALAGFWTFPPLS